MRVQFVLISEGSSDNGLISHLESVCIYAGADEARGIALDRQRLPPSVGNKVSDKLRAAMILEPQANLFLIHRDSDAPDPQLRYEEVRQAVNECQLQKPWVAIIPIQETEAWLLLDESAIRRIASKPNGTKPLGLPTADTVENESSPKERLKQAIFDANPVAGRRHEKLKRDFPTHRQILLQGLSIDGAIRNVPSWQRMKADLTAAVAATAENGSSPTSEALIAL